MTGFISFCPSLVAVLVLIRVLGALDHSPWITGRAYAGFELRGMPLAARRYSPVCLGDSTRSLGRVEKCKNGWGCEAAQMAGVEQQAQSGREEGEGECLPEFGTSCSMFPALTITIDAILPRLMDRQQRQKAADSLASSVPRFCIKFASACRTFR